SIDHYVVGDVAVFYGILSYSQCGTALDVDTRTVRFSYPLTTILRLKAGKVVAHEDFVDYQKWEHQKNS
ncbi:hypothetical protein, partial [Xanthovirga aplysinae]|uniref:hypothetical protein n=1 Tax=Xanthovirga aplysinae TaxID=2529853 RepID=UPI0016572061